MTEFLPQLLFAWSVQLTGALSPGPSVALVVSIAVSQGRLPALLAALGVGVGTFILATATAFGIAALFAQMDQFMVFVRLFGAAYLVYLAIRSFRKAWLAKEIRISQNVPHDMMGSALRGFVIQSSNPQAILFWLAIASMGGAGESPLHIKALFVFGAFLISFVSHGAYGLLLSSAPIRHAYDRARSWIEIGFGIFFLFAAYMLLKHFL